MRVFGESRYLLMTPYPTLFYIYFAVKLQQADFCICEHLGNNNLLLRRHEPGGYEPRPAPQPAGELTTELRRTRVSTEFRRHGIPRNFLTSEVISAQFQRNSAKFRGIPRNFAGIAPEITSVFRGMPKCHFRGHPTPDPSELHRTH
jgi:hypothetical protein